MDLVQELCVLKLKPPVGWTTTTEEFFVVRKVRDSLNINLIRGERDPGMVIETDDEDRPYVFDDEEDAWAQVRILQWQAGIRYEDGSPG